MTGRDEMRLGWRYVLGAFVGIGGGFASLYFYTAGLFIKPMAVEFGWTRSEASLSAISFTIGNIVGLPVVGRMVDRYGERTVAFNSGLLLAGCFVLLALFTKGLVSFLSLVLLLTVLSAGSNSIGYNRIIVRHFLKWRGLALGLALTGTGFGAALLPRSLAPFIADNGWRPAFLVLAGLAAVMTTLATLLIKERPTAAGRAEIPPPRPWREICRHPAFFSIAAIIFLASTAVLGTTLHLVALMSDARMTPAQAGAVAAALGFSVLGGRVGVGYLLDNWDAGIVACLLLVLAGVGAMLLWTSSASLALPGAILIGLGVGTEGDLLAYLLSRRFSVQDFGSVYGTIFAVHALGGGVGGVLAGRFYDLTGSYGLWLLLSAAGLSVAGVIALMTERGFESPVEPPPL